MPLPTHPKVRSPPVLSLRAQAQLEGVSPSTVHRHRQRAAKAQPTAPIDLAAAVQALATAQAQQAALLTKLLGGASEIQLPAKAKEQEVAEAEEEKPVSGGHIPSPTPMPVGPGRRRFVVTLGPEQHRCPSRLPGILARLRCREPVRNPGFPLQLQQVRLGQYPGHDEGCRTVVVESNHDEAFRRWLSEADGHRDAANARFWHFWNYRMFQAVNSHPIVAP